MFTGIITDLGTIDRVSGTTDIELDIVPAFDMRDLAIGASVAHSGICLTVVRRSERSYTVQATAETARRTTIGSWRPGTRVNLERSLRLGDELGGHLVFGHVDAVAHMEEIREEGNGRRIVFRGLRDLAPLLAVKGSVAVDGISLTVTEAENDGFAVMIIPHSWQATTLADRREGDRVNIEADMLARYVARQLAYEARSAADAR
jgi:riboflavin synthase